MSLADLYVTTGQAAAALWVNRLTIQRWVKSGKLSGERVGSVTLIPKVEVERLVARRQREDGG